MRQLKRLLIPLLILPFAFEFTVRLEDWIRFSVPITSAVSGLGELDVVDQVGHHARAGATFRKFHINALGFRGPERTAAELKSRALIVVSGASESFGLYEAAGREWPRQLEDSVDRRCPSAPVNVLNAAFAGMALPTVVQDVQLRLQPLKPTVIVYYPTPSQYLFESVPKVSPASSDTEPAESRWKFRSVPRVRELVKSAIPAPLLEFLRRTDTERLRAAGETPFPSLPSERVDSLEAHLRTLIGAVRATGATMIMVLPQHRFADTTSLAERRWLRGWEHLQAKASGQMLLEFHELASARIRAVASDSSVRLVDPGFTTGPERAKLFADPVHFTDRGAAVLAGKASESVADVLGCTAGGASAPPAR